MKNPKIIIVLPAYCEGRIIKKVVEDIKEKGYDDILVVDDGSSDDTVVKAISANVKVISHPINRGKGAATQTGLDAARLLEADIIVTMDSDGQHNPSDIRNLVKPIIIDNADVTIGSRFLKRGNGIPKSRIVMNRIANFVTYIFFGLYVSDSQSGFRAYSKKACDMVYTHLDRYEFESEMLGEIKKSNLRVVEVPIEVTYSKYSRTKYNHLGGFSSQGFFNGVKMVLRLLERSLFN